MSLRDYLSVWKVPDFRIPESPLQLARAAQDLEQKFIAIAVPPQTDLQRTYEHLRSVGLEALERLPPTHRRNSPWVLFEFKAAVNQVESPSPVLAADPNFISGYLVWLESTANRRLIQSTVNAFLLAYPVALPTFDLIRECLADILRRNPGGRLQRMQEWVEQNELLEPEGPLSFVRRWLDTDRADGPAGDDHYLEGADFHQDLRAKGFLLEGYNSVLGRIKQRIASGNLPRGAVKRILEISEPSPSQAAGGLLRFESEAGALMNALLEPWHNAPSRPTDRDDQQQILNFFRKKFGHPRIGPRWGVASQRSRDVMLRWIVGVALQDFFKILEITADEVWKYRQEFWMEYEEKRVIEDAWLLLGPDAQREAKRRLGEMDYGRLLTTERNQSVLQLKIGDLYLTEFSHVGKCWAAKFTDSDIVPLGVPKAPASALRNGTLKMHDGKPGLIHSNSEGKLWQSRLAKFIRDHTGIDHSARKLYRG